MKIVAIIIVGYLIYHVYLSINKKKVKNTNIEGIVLTEEQKERYAKELASDKWKEY